MDRSRGFFVTLGFVQAAWPLTMDLYLPAFPRIEQQLAAAPGQVQLTLTGAFLGMALGQVATGPLSDRIGRVGPLMGALVVHGLATATCAIAGTIEVLIAARVVQGLGAAACAVTTLAIVRDCASGPRMVRLLARLQLVNGAFVLGAPAMGALLVGAVDWRGIFWILLAVMAALTAAVLVFVVGRETHPGHAHDLAPWTRLASDYRLLARDHVYLAAVVANMLLWGGMMSYVASSAFLFQQFYGLSPTGYALVFGGHGGLMIITAQIGARWAQRSGLAPVLRGGAAAVAVSAVALTVSVASSPAHAIVAFLVPLFAFTAGFGLLSPSLQSRAMLCHGERAGTAASLLGASNMLASAVAAPAVAAVGLFSALPVAGFMTVCAVASGLVTWLVVARNPAALGSAVQAR